MSLTIVGIVWICYGAIALIVFWISMYMYEEENSFEDSLGYSIICGLFWILILLSGVFTWSYHLSKSQRKRKLEKSKEYI